MRAMVLVLALMLMGASAARADTNADCQQAKDQELSIRACTLIIDGRAKGSKAAAYYNRGNAYSNKGDHDQAIADYDEAIGLNPRYSHAYNNRGNAYRNKGDTARAFADFEESIRLDPKNAVAYVNRGLAYSNRGDAGRAIADYGEAIRLNPKYAMAYYDRGNAYSNKGDYDRAIADYDEAIRLNPKNAYAYNNRGNAYRNKGDTARAFADFEESIRLDPKNAVAYVNRGNAYRNRGDSGRAFADYGEAIRLNPKYAAALLCRGRIYESQGKTALAIADYRMALEGEANDAAGRKAQAAARDRLAALEGGEKPAQAAPSASGEPPAAAAPQALGRRVALVIGNSAYDAVATLPNARKDAAAIAARLETLGFDVTQRYDLSIDEMRRTFAAFEAKADGADWALVYYAGHGIELDGENWLIPKDSKLAHDSDVADETFSLKRVLDRMKRAHFRMVLLDACRNNPFLNRMKMAMAKRAVNRGLGRIEPARGEVVFYAARAGTVASDGDDGNGPFAAALLAHMSDEGLELGRFFRKVTTTVERLTNNEQEPFVYGTIPDTDLYLKPLQ